jgi:hypothetical protein
MYRTASRLSRWLPDHLLVSFIKGGYVPLTLRMDLAIGVTVEDSIPLLVTDCYT